MKKWGELLVKAAPLVDYLNRTSYFDKAYSGTLTNRLVLTDAIAARAFATDDSFETFEDWETVSDSGCDFPDSFEWKSWIDHNLDKNNYFGIAAKNLNGADAKWTHDDICPLLELMHRDIMILLNCYENDHFPDIWRDILDVYLKDGFPCGWSGIRPPGKLVIFSNF